MIAWVLLLALQEPSSCTASVSHDIAGASVSAAKRTTATLSLFNPSVLPQQILITLYRPGRQQPIALSALVPPREPRDVFLHSYVTNGAFGIHVACAGTCAVTVSLQDGTRAARVLPVTTSWGCL